MRILLALAWSFALIGLAAYGGGLATVPLIQAELVGRRAWLTFDEMSAMMAVAQMTPGPIAINAATFVGYRMDGVAGAVVATGSIVIPSILVLALVSRITSALPPSTAGLRLKEGLRAGVLSLLVFATGSFGRGVVTSWSCLLLALVAFALLVCFEKRLHPVVVMVGAGLVGTLIW